MSPIIELQRRMVEAGRIRAGDQQPDSKGVLRPHKIENWRLTSKDELRLRRAADLWGGESRAWEGHPGEFELYTDTASLPIMLLPGQVPTTWYELWSRGGCQRRCDGQHETISDSSCLCGEERECKPHTRLSVLLPDLPGIGSWLLSSTGWNAAAELAGAADLLQRASTQGVLIPARLRLEQRVQVTGGQTRRFAVPVIDIDVSFRELLGGNQGAVSTPSDRALPSGYIPIEKAAGNGATLADGLREAETQTLAKPPRVPLAEDDDILDDEPGAPAPPSPGVPAQEPQTSSTGNTVAASTRDKLMTGAQKDKLGVYVGWLRDDTQKITTEHLYKWVAERREKDVSTLIDDTADAYDAAGVLRWGPLLKTLTRGEANGLIDALVTKYGKAPTRETAA